jgi:hypothetical protein
MGPPHLGISHNTLVVSFPDDVQRVDSGGDALPGLASHATRTTAGALATKDKPGLRCQFCCTFAPGKVPSYSVTTEEGKAYEDINRT